MNTSTDKLVYLPKDKLHDATGIVMHIKNHWWAVDSEKGLLFFVSGRRKELRHASPQCNQNEAIMRRLNHWPGTVIEFIPSVLQPIDVSDYAP